MNNPLKRAWDAEPALLMGAVHAFVTLAVAFGLELSGEQIAAISAAVAAVLAVVVRSQVTPTTDTPAPADPPEFA